MDNDNAIAERLEFEHYNLAVWQMMEVIRDWLDGEYRSDKEIAASLESLSHNCWVAASRSPEGDDERFKIQAAAGLLSELISRIPRWQVPFLRPVRVEDDSDPVPF